MQSAVLAMTDTSAHLSCHSPVSCQNDSN